MCKWSACIARGCSRLPLHQTHENGSDEWVHCSNIFALCLHNAQSHALASCSPTETGAEAATANESTSFVIVVVLILVAWMGILILILISTTQVHFALGELFSTQQKQKEKRKKKCI